MCSLALKRQVVIHPGFVVACATMMLALAVAVVMAAYDRVLLVSNAVVGDVARLVSTACPRTFWLCAGHAPTSRVESCLRVPTLHAVCGPLSHLAVVRITVCISALSVLRYGPTALTRVAPLQL